ncbi:hypothetical protein [Paenarthrobacter histidinolovorans]|uniref:Uncharacterized protein n=1 Tax=Paenarthrobacter histidinolovorans TaxID=43664 RepID=A0ABW8N7D5_9MICC
MTIVQNAPHTRINRRGDDGRPNRRQGDHVRPTSDGAPTTTPEMLIADFVVGSAQERDFELDRALGTARFKAAMEGKQGILVTRHDFCRFSVRLTSTVPFGAIHEKDNAERN